MAAWSLTGCVTVGDKTVGQTAVCEVHSVTMKTKRVREWGGLLLSKPPIFDAREVLFPHADEPRYSGGCVRAYDYVKIYVCPRCTSAREQWLAANLPFR